MCPKFSLTPRTDLLDALPKDFTLFFGSKRYVLPRAKAMLFSPMIQKKVASTPGLRSIEVEEVSETEFRIIVDLIEGRSVQIMQSTIDFIFRIAVFFEINEVVRRVSEYLLEFMGNDYAFAVLKNPLNFLACAPSYFYFTKNFESLVTEERMYLLPLESYEHIFSSEDFSMAKGSTLLNFILGLIERRGRTFAPLLRFVDFSLVTLDESSRAFKQLSPENIEESLLKQVKAVLLKRAAQFCAVKSASLSVVAAPKTESLGLVASIPFNEDDIFEGVLGYYLNEDIDIDDYVHITGGGEKSWALKFLLDPYNDSKFWENSSTVKDTKVYKDGSQWLMFEFLQHKLSLTHYALSHPLKKPNLGNPRSWVIYGSNDGENWTVLDTVENTDSLNSPNAFSAFPLPSPSPPFSFFMFEQKNNFRKNDTSLANRLILSGFEFFGDLYER